MLDWTHKNVSICDIRKLHKVYVIGVNLYVSEFSQDLQDKKNLILFVKDNIFEERIKGYFLKNDMNNISREDILKVSWNMYISQGYHIKLNENGEVIQFPHDKDKWYVSYLEVAGLLGMFSSIIKEKE